MKILLHINEIVVHWNKPKKKKKSQRLSIAQDKIRTLQLFTQSPMWLQWSLASGSFQSCLPLYVTFLYSLNLVVFNWIILFPISKYQTIRSTFLQHTLTLPMFSHASRFFLKLFPLSWIPPLLVPNSFWLLQCKYLIQVSMKIKEMIQQYVKTTQLTLRP